MDEAANVMAACVIVGSIEFGAVGVADVVTEGVDG